MQLSPPLASSLKNRLTKKAMPSFIKPMLATLTQHYFNDASWIFERKFDGQRCLIFKHGTTIILKSRNNKNLNGTYPELVDAAKNLPVKSVILDGEVVALRGTATSFEKLQQRFGIIDAGKARASGITVYMYIFDILYLDGYDLTELPLITRKKLLKTIPLKTPLRYTTHTTTHGQKFLKQACHKHWEGLIAKNKMSTYVSQRSQQWLKFKCVEEQELVIGGFTESDKILNGFGALLLGYYKNKKLIYAGKVGTGFSDNFLTTFRKKLNNIETKKSPFSSEVREKNVHFVKPRLVAQIGFEEWTRDNKLRQARFKGLRDDKNPKDVTRE